MGRYDKFLYQELLAMRQTFGELRDAVKDMKKELESWRPRPVSMRYDDLLSLPFHFQRTVLAVAAAGEAGIEEIAHVCGISREPANVHLNNLVMLGWLKWRKDGRRKLYRLSEDKNNAVYREKTEKNP